MNFTMLDYRRMAVFAAVVRHGSLSQAARRLGISTSAVSQHLRALEQGFGVTLVHRTTRKLTLTDAGEGFAAHCLAMVSAAEQAQAQLQLAHEAPVGQLRIAAPVGFARHVGPALAPLLERHPGLDLHLLVADEMIDLVEARIDLALRAGRLPDSSWTARRLCTFDMVLCASPSYLAAHGTPHTPVELASHRWLGSPRDGGGVALTLGSADGAAAAVQVTPRVTSNNQFSLQQMCAAGLGIAVMVRPDIEHDLRSGRLVPVLPGWTLPAIPILAVTPQRDAQPAKVRHAIAALQDYLRDTAGAHA